MRMARRGALAQQLNAIESLASVDIDLPRQDRHADRAARSRVEAIVPAAGVDEGELARALGRFAASSPTRERDARRDRRLQHRRRRGAAERPCRSRRAAAGARCSSAGRRTCSARPSSSRSAACRRSRTRRPRSGRRVVALRHRPRATSTRTRRRRSRQLARPRRARRAAARATRARRSRSCARRASSSQVLSGDRPETVAASPRTPASTSASRVDGSDLPPDAAALRRLVDEHAVVGRISPEGKRRVVEALARRRPLRRDGRRRRQRRARAEGGAARDRAGQRRADGARRRRPRARPRRLRVRPADGRGGPQGAAQPPARREALRHEVGVRGVPRSSRSA